MTNPIIPAAVTMFRTLSQAAQAEAIGPHPTTLAEAYEAVAVAIEDKWVTVEEVIRLLSHVTSLADFCANLEAAAYAATLPFGQSPEDESRFNDFQEMMCDAATTFARLQEPPDSPFGFAI